jgi:hypothetical protein
MSHENRAAIMEDDVQIKICEVGVALILKLNRGNEDVMNSFSVVQNLDRAEPRILSRDGKMLMVGLPSKDNYSGAVSPPQLRNHPTSDGPYHSRQGIK